jgi:hypothetical protein
MPAPTANRSTKIGNATANKSDLNIVWIQGVEEQKCVPAPHTFITQIVCEMFPCVLPVSDDPRLNSLRRGMPLS